MLKIGWSRKDVSTDKPINIPGQFRARISEGVHDPITVTALCLENSGDLAILVSGDFVNCRDCIIDEIREKIHEKNADIPVEKVNYSVTHTHASPSYQRADDLLTGVPTDGVDIYPSQEYRKFLVDRISDAVVESWQNRRDGGIAYGYCHAVIGHSRRVVYLDDLALRPGADNTSSLVVDGHAKMYGNTNDDMVAGYEGGADTIVNIMFTFDTDKKMTGAIINVPCPSQCSEHASMLSASFWNEARNMIRAKYGDIEILPQCSAAGDSAPYLLHYKDAELRRHALKYADQPETIFDYHIRLDIAQQIAFAFDDVYSWAPKEIDFDPVLRHSVKIFKLEQRLISEEQYTYSCEQYEKLSHYEFVHTDKPLEDLWTNSVLGSKNKRFKEIMNRYEEQKETKTADTEVHIIRLGDIAFATNPFELYTDFQTRIQSRSPFIQTFIVQLSAPPHGWHSGYLATERGVDNVGYSATMFCNQVSPEGGQTLVNETVKELKNLK